MTNYATMSHPEARKEAREKADASHRETLAKLGQKIDLHRRLLHPMPSDRQWVKQWPGLGSAKTWSRVLKADFEQMDVSARIPAYRAVLSALDAERTHYEAEALYDDLAGAEAVQLETLRLMHHHGKDRLILVEGGSGSGKTSCIDLLERGVAAGQIKRVEANESWKSLRVAMGDILKAYGYGTDKRPIGTSTGERMDQLLDAVGNSGRSLLAIDEAHHATGAVLNILKTLLNRTETLMILAGMRTLFQKLRASSSEESNQLIHNRLFARIILGNPDANGVATFIQRRTQFSGSWKKSTLSEISEASKMAGHWSFVRRVCDHLMTAGVTEPDDADLMSARESALLEIAA